MPQGQELDGWKAIADYLDVGTRTAQKWEKERGLPVKRMGEGPKARVFAEIDEVQAWRENQFQTSRAGYWKGAVLVPLALVALVTTMFLALSEPPNPEYAEVFNKELRILDRDRKVLWTRFFEAMENRPWDFVNIEDLDGDGLNEVLFALVRSTGLTDALYCFGPRGALRWKYEVDDWLNGEPALHGAYKINGGLGTVGDGTRTFVLLITKHSTEGQARVVLLSPADGRVLDEYWHPGRFDAFLRANLDDDRGDELILRGYNNPRGLGHAAVAVLNVPFDKAEENPNGNQNFYGAWNAKERDYLLFPRIPTHEALRRRTGTLGAYFEDEMIVFVTSTWGEGMNSLYYFDRKLQSLLRFRPSDPMLSHHRELYRRGDLASDATPEEITRWARVKRFCTAPDGDDPQVAEAVKNSHEVAASIHTGEEPPPPAAID